MKFNQLINFLTESGVDPMKFAYKGAPQGFRKDTGISNPEKFTPTSPSRAMYDPNEGNPNAGGYIQADVFRLMRAALMVAASDPEAGTELKRVIDEFGQVYQQYVMARTHARNARTDYDRMPDLVFGKKPKQYTDKGVALLELEKKQTELAGKLKEELIQKEPDLLNAVHDLVREGAMNFVNKIKSSKQQEIKALDEIGTKAEDDDVKAAVRFLKDVFMGKGEFVPLSKFAQAEREQNKMPAARLFTIYKSVIDTMARNHLVDNPEKTFDYITGQTSKVRSIAEPTLGRKAMKEKDPQIMKVIAMIKQQKFEDAKKAVNTTKLADNKKADLMMNIEKLKNGKVTEAEVIRPLYQA